MTLFGFAGHMLHINSSSRFKNSNNFSSEQFGKSGLYFEYCNHSSLSVKLYLFKKSLRYAMGPHLYKAPWYSCILSFETHSSQLFLGCLSAKGLALYPLPV